MGEASLWWAGSGRVASVPCITARAGQRRPRPGAPAASSPGPGSRWPPSPARPCPSYPDPGTPWPSGLGAASNAGPLSLPAPPKGGPRCLWVPLGQRGLCRGWGCRTGPGAPPSRHAHQVPAGMLSTLNVPGVGLDFSSLQVSVSGKAEGVCHHASAGRGEGRLLLGFIFI